MLILVDLLYLIVIERLNCVWKQGMVIDMIEKLTSLDIAISKMKEFMKRLYQKNSLIRFSI